MGQPIDDVVAAVVAGVGDRDYVTQHEIFAAVPDLEPETADLEALFAALTARGIAIVDEVTEELRREDAARAAEPPSARRRGTPSVRRNGRTPSGSSPTVRSPAAN